MSDEMPDVCPRCGGTGQIPVFSDGINFPPFEDGELLGYNTCECRHSAIAATLEALAASVAASKGKREKENAN